jgi:hypothetical protein
MPDKSAFENFKIGFVFGVGGALGSLAVWTVVALLFASTAKPVPATTRAASGKTPAPCEKV